jgi:hypothetical protein
VDARATGHTLGDLISGLSEEHQAILRQLSLLEVTPEFLQKYTGKSATDFWKALKTA